MAGDAIAVMDAEGLEAPVVMGYSMGGYLGMQLLMRHGARVAKLVIGGVGETYSRPRRNSRAIGDRRRARNRRQEHDRRPRSARDFRAFAEQAGKDLKALAACMRADRKTLHGRAARAERRSPCSSSAARKTN